MNESLALAEIAGVYGIRGWVKLRLFLENPQTLSSVRGLMLEVGPKGRPMPPRAVTIDAVRPQGKGYIAHLEGVDDRDSAEALKGLRLCAPADQLPPAGDDEYYWRDLFGLKVWCRDIDSDESVLLGEIDHLLDTGANDVMVIRASADSIDDRERLVPWLPDSVVTRVELDKGEVWVDWYTDA